MQEKSEMKFDVDWEANEKVSIDKQAKMCKQGVICELEWEYTQLHALQSYQVYQRNCHGSK